MTVPEIEPPSAMAAPIPLWLPPAVTATAVAEDWLDASCHHWVT